MLGTSILLPLGSDVQATYSSCDTYAIPGEPQYGPLRLFARSYTLQTILPRGLSRLLPFHVFRLPPVYIGPFVCFLSCFYPPITLFPHITHGSCFQLESKHTNTLSLSGHEQLLSGIVLVFHADYDNFYVDEYMTKPTVSNFLYQVKVAAACMLTVDGVWMRTD